MDDHRFASDPKSVEFFADHSRRWADHRYVYAVVSRRSGGVSIGINLSPDKRCVFRCVYCQVARDDLSRNLADDADICGAPIDLATLEREAGTLIEAVCNGTIFTEPRFVAVPPPLRRPADIALSGDGEPTACPQFAEVVELLANMRRRHCAESLPLVLITNAALLHLPHVQRGLEVLDAFKGKIWAKLDVGTESYYRRVARSRIPWQRILDNLRDAARRRPIVVQTLLMTLDGRRPDEFELSAYIDRLREILDGGGQIEFVQLHTVVRPPAEQNVGPLPTADLQRAAERIRNSLGLTVSVFDAQGPAQ